MVMRMIFQNKPHHCKFSATISMAFILIIAWVIASGSIYRKVMSLIFYLPKFLFFFKYQCHLLQNSSLGQLHTHGDVVPLLVAALEVFNRYGLQHVPYNRNKCFDLLDRIANEQDFFSCVITGDESWIF